MNDRFKICWATEIKDTAIGNAYGYKVHSQTLRKYVEKYADLTEDAKDAVFIISPEFFNYQFPDKRNWLFTMFEGLDIPELYRKQIEKADMLLTPSTWVKELFGKCFDPAKIFVVPHGIEPEFTFFPRTFPKLIPFRFLWVGASNPRKGWEEVNVIWSNLFAAEKDVELYVKTTGSNKLERRGNVIFDSRDIPRKELIDLYHSAHAFIFPTRGEGFGLTLAEALATGLPCIATGFSGHMDFFSEHVGYPVGYKIGPAKLTVTHGEFKDTEMLTRTAYPIPEEIVAAMTEIYFNYKAAVEKAAWGSRLLKSKFTWDNSAKTLINILKEAGNG